MNLSKEIKTSKTARFLGFLFGGEWSASFSESLTGRLTKRFYMPYLSSALLLSALLLFWYEAPISKYLPIVTNSYIAPALIIFALIFSKKESIVITKPTVWYAGFLIFGLLSGLFGVTRGLNPTMLILGWVVYAIFFVTLFTSQAFENKTSFIKFMFLILIPNALIGIWQYFFKPTDLFPITGETAGRAVGLFTNPNVFGMVMVLTSLVGAWLYLRTKNLLYLAGFGISLLAVFVSFSRTSWIALALGLLVLMLMYFPKWIKYTPLALLVILIPRVWSRILSIFSSNYIYEASVDGRIWTLKNGLYIWKNNPILGAGPGSYGGKLAELYGSPVALSGLQNGYRAIATTDNSWIEILVQLGIIGIMSLIGFFVSLIYDLIHSKNEYRALALAFVVSFVVMMVFSNAFEFNAVAAPVATLIGFGLFRADA